MNARTYYISLLLSPGADAGHARTFDENIRKGLLDWLLYRKYLEHDDCLEKLAGDFDVTKEEISCFVVSRTGMKFRTMKKNLRMSDAKEMLLKHPEMPIYQISASVGIPDKSNFKRMFKEEVGYTPAIWKKGKGKPCLCRVISILESGRSHCLSHHRTS